MTTAMERAPTELMPMGEGDARIRALTRPDFTYEDLAVVRNVIAPKLDDAELRVFAHRCRVLGLDPMAREVYAWKSTDGKLTIQTAIDGFRKAAQRTGRYAGQSAPLFSDDGERWTEAWVKDTPPLVCKVIVYRLDSEHPTSHTCLYREFRRDTPPWKQMPVHMLAVRTEAHALRKAFSGCEGMDALELIDPEIPQASIREERGQRGALADRVAGTEQHGSYAGAAMSGAPPQETPASRGTAFAAYRRYCQAHGIDPQDREARIDTWGVILGAPITSSTTFGAREWAQLTAGLTREVEREEQRQAEARTAQPAEGGQGTLGQQAAGELPLGDDPFQEEGAVPAAFTT